MPHLRIITNQSLTKAKREKLIKAASQLVSEHLKKPEGYVMITVQDDTSMGFAGTCSPAAYLDLESIGFKEKPADLAPVLCAFVEGQLGVPAERTYVKFVDLDAEYFGWNGATFA